ncbi:hypothetical protein AJ78_00524 [Emergomyces pasteurianus Ep9510]|uniref:Uncharacterized protein n=1 Tax=Emergomyces pasteurianus Ep9510 TaxID=1447872 RepID=A0A1J9PT10_9EURO|nr:hypothetical protein AJ78_00524 [Emergomyces pasteurianus Ep9510]
MGHPKPIRPYTPRDDASLSSSSSVHSLQSYHDLEPDDSPPAYVEVGTPAAVQDGTTNTPGANNLSSVGPLMSMYEVTGGRVISSCCTKKTYTVTLSPELSQDLDALHTLIIYQAERPPVPIIVVKGTHTVKSKCSDSKKGSNNETVVDFDFRINCLNSVLPDINRPGNRCRIVEILKDDDGKKAYRGGSFKSKGPSKKKCCRGARADADLEEAQGLTARPDGPDVEGWCQRFCEDPASTKSFTLHRAVEAWDHQAIQRGITSLIRSLNYRGHICIEIHTHNANLTVYSPSLLNKLRTNNSVWWVCIILQLWLITWPLLIILEKRYEPITATWYAWYNEVYACGLSEANWLELFTPVIKRSVLARAKDGEVIGLEEARGAREEANRVGSGLLGMPESESEMERRQRMQRGEGNWADSLVGAVRGVTEVRSAYNLSAGWGGDC